LESVNLILELGVVIVDVEGIWRHFLGRDGGHGELCLPHFHDHDELETSALHPLDNMR
jgi:hypothetical protein